LHDVDFRARFHGVVIAAERSRGFQMPGWARRARLGLALLSLTVWTPPASSQTDSGSPDFHRTLERLATDHHICAVATAVIKNRQIDAVDSATGCRPELSLGRDSIFQAASLSKPVFAYAVMKLAEKRKLDLDVPLIQYLPQGYLHRQNPFDATNAPKFDLVTARGIQSVTARMVLNHTSGLPNWSQEPLAFDFDPGTKWQYSGEGYVLLQRAVESITGAPLDQFMQTQVFRTLNMTHSSYVWDETFDSNIVPTLSSTGEAMDKWRFRAPLAAATLYTTAADYGNFLAALLRDSQTLDQVIKSPVNVDQDLNLSWGLGWGIERNEDDLFIWHWGNNPGYRAFVIASVKSGNGFVMFTDSDDGLALAEPLTAMILPGAHRIFQFYMLRDGVNFVLCKTFRWCT
jgi:CubicO group peptidase (beta-lactamase class C family)